jgi:hypothetical protein
MALSSINICIPCASKRCFCTRFREGRRGFWEDRAHLAAEARRAIRCDRGHRLAALIGMNGDSRDRETIP